MIVLDASAVIEWLLGRPLADAVETRLAPEHESLHAPHLLPIEVAQVLRRFEARGSISAERGATALDDLGDLDVTYHAHDILLPGLWRLRHNLTAYDAAYVALAELLDAPLLTLDARLAAAPGLPCDVELIR